MREYWLNGDNCAPDFAARILGSGDIYDRRGRRPWSSVNFVCAHDGFTLNDLVSYDGKHNEANGEDNNDGHNHNLSHNYGEEGPTENPDINAIRERQKRNFLASLFFSHGTPMLLAGDEFGRSQMGNNNGYCQDSDISWLHWEDLPQTCDDLRDFTRRLIELRKSQPLLRRENWRDGTIIEWHNAEGGEQLPEHWLDGNTLVLRLRRDDLLASDEPGVWTEVLLMFNPVDAEVDFVMPTGEARWQLELRTDDPNASQDTISDGQTFKMPPRSLGLFSIVK